MSTTITNKQKSIRPTRFQIIEGLEGIAVIIACYITLFLKPLRDRWGLAKKEAEKSYPGDVFVPNPKTQFTHGIKINAPVEFVWPWLAQIGQGRGGFYSYELLENIAGLNIKNADEIIPEFQHPQLGDLISFGGGSAFPIVICNVGKAMAIENWLDLDTNKVYNPRISQPKNYLHLTWLWHVESLNENQCLFVSRNRVDYSSNLKSKLMFGFMTEPIVFAMDRKMCLGIKKRAERFYNNSAHRVALLGNAKAALV